jgi:primary-amine oxidase
LSPSEIALTVELLRAEDRLPDNARFVAVSTAEPPKETLADVIAQGARLAEAVVVAGPITVEAVVDLVNHKVVHWHERDDVQPPMNVEEFFAVEQAVRENPQFVEALRRRGIEDLSLVDIDPISAGYHGLEYEVPGRRLARILAFVRPYPAGNAYARPVEGVFGVVDVATGEFVHFEDRNAVPLPPDEGEFRAAQLPVLRDDLRPIEITQPEGASFGVHGYELRWQRWKLRLGYTQREGLVLHDVSYEDGERARSILHRASFAEMVVPYADPDRAYQSPLDIGEFNIGTMTNSLMLGCDCLGLIQYFDVAYVAPDGSPVEVKNGICVHEEDDGLLWKHTDFRTEHVEVRRSRRLVVSTIATVGNYDYGFYWYFHLDGTIAAEVKATGIVATKAFAEGEEPEFGKLVAPQLSATNHQHAFCARLDFDLDGLKNTVCEVESVSVPRGPNNPHGNAWRTVERPLVRELEAQRNVNPSTARTWLVTNPEKKNRVGQPIAYRLVPGDNTIPFCAEDSYQRRRAGFLDHHLWVTPYSPTERYPAGDYPYQHTGGAGLAEWTISNRAIEAKDVVVWYTLIHHHVPRPEDWPVMPVARIGFELRPVGFFDCNPALDVPPPAMKCH